MSNNRWVCKYLISTEPDDIEVFKSFHKGIPSAAKEIKERLGDDKILIHKLYRSCDCKSPEPEFVGFCPYIHEHPNYHHVLGIIEKSEIIKCHGYKKRSILKLLDSNVAT